MTYCDWCSLHLSHPRLMHIAITVSIKGITGINLHKFCLQSVDRQSLKWGWQWGAGWCDALARALWLHLLWIGLVLQPSWRWSKMPKEVTWHKLYLLVKRDRRDPTLAFGLIWGAECSSRVGCSSTVKQHSPLPSSGCRMLFPSLVPSQQPPTVSLLEAKVAQKKFWK